MDVVVCSSMHLYGRRLGGVELGRPATSQQAPVASQCRTVVVSSSSGLVMAFHGPSYGLSRECAMKVAITVVTQPSFSLSLRVYKASVLCTLRRIHDM